MPGSGRILKKKQKKSVAQAIEEQCLITDVKKYDDLPQLQEEEEEEDIIGGDTGGDGRYCIDNFPPGYRFRPTDAELVKYYLLRKLDNKPLPHDKIKEVFLYQKSPQELTDENWELGNNEWYFFTPRERKYKHGKRPNRKAGDGYWKATGADKKITWNGNDANVIGLKKSLVFYDGKPPRGTKSEWIMHEYIANRPKRNKLHENDMRLDDWVLCRLRKKPESANKPRLLERDNFNANHVSSLDEESSLQNSPQFSHNDQVAMVHMSQMLQTSQQFSHNDQVASVHTSQMDGQGVPTGLLTNTHDVSSLQTSKNFSQNDQVATIHMSQMDGQGVPTGLLITNTHNVPHQDLHYDYSLMNFNYGVQQDVFTPPLGYHVGTNSNISHCRNTQFSYSHNFSYQKEQLDAKQMMDSGFDFGIQAVHSNIVDSEISYILGDEWASENIGEFICMDSNPVEPVK